MFDENFFQFHFCYTSCVTQVLKTNFKWSLSHIGSNHIGSKNFSLLLFTFKTEWKETEDTDLYLENKFDKKSKVSTTTKIQKISN